MPSNPPAISTLLKPSIYKEMMEEREVVESASLDDAKDPIAGKPYAKEHPLKRYSFHTAMLARASLAETRAVITNYKLYSELVPYVDKTEFSPITKILTLEGGIWKFKLASQIKFEELGERWIRYTIVGGHFTGLSGDIFFESAGEKGTIVYLSGAQLGRHWPPAFVITRGAEIVFQFTASRMRKYIETEKSQPSAAEKKKNDDDKIPQPRRRL